jgi:sugar/nucleoside kinase (ribokinase family)
MRKAFMSETSLEAAVIGNVGIDTNVFFQSSGPTFDQESNFTENIDYVGQAGGYAGRGFARLGKKTAFIGYVGDDYQGRFVREELERDGIDLSALFIDPAGTSRSINFMYPDGRRKNFYDGKSHMKLMPDLACCREVLARARLAHFNIPNWARRLLPIARELGLTISCDIQDVISVDDPYRRDFIREADILFFSAINQGDPAPLIREFMARSTGGFGDGRGRLCRRAERANPVFPVGRRRFPGGRYQRRRRWAGGRPPEQLCAGRLFAGRVGFARADRSALYLCAEGQFGEPDQRRNARRTVWPVGAPL